ncbi:MAG: ABC transporter ATP-binding protein [Phycisphaerales bacterium]
MVEIKSLSKSFGPILAVDRVSFSVDRGEVLGFLGPNGAGKSTTMKMVTGFLPPTGGTALVCGHDVVAEPLAVKERIGYLPEGAPAYPDMTPESFLAFVSRVRGLNGAARKAAIARVVEKVHLEGVMRQTIETLSKGYKRRVGLAQAILHDPDVLIMDEPTDGLDPNQKHEVRALIQEMARGGATGPKAIVLSTHILEEVEAVCTRTVIIARGRIVFDGTPRQLAAKSRHHNAVVLGIKSSPGVRIAEELRKLTHVASVLEQEPANGQVRCTVFPRDGRTIADEVGQHARGRGWQVEELHVQSGRLDEVFRDLTGGGLKP